MPTKKKASGPIPANTIRMNDYVVCFVWPGGESGPRNNSKRKKRRKKA